MENSKQPKKWLLVDPSLNLAYSSKKSFDQNKPDYILDPKTNTYVEVIKPSKS